MKNLKDTTREHFEDVALSKEQLRDLNALVSQKEQATAPRTLSPKRSARIKLLLVAAVLVIGFGLMAYARNLDDKSRLIADEVAYNHLKLKPLEVTTNALPQVAAYFAEHRIHVVENSSVLSQFDWDLTGGRFCSIQGVDAAQLRYKTKSNETVSVYMAPYSSSTMGVLPTVEDGGVPVPIVVDGNEVWIWVEQNQVIASTIPPSR